MYEAQSEKDWKFIINDSESKLVLVATEKAYERAEHYVNTVIFLLSSSLIQTATHNSSFLLSLFAIFF